MGKTGFKDRAFKEPKEKKISSPWNFDAPCYDERSGPFVSAGTRHGVGKTQPVGSFGSGAGNAAPIGNVKTLGLNAHSKTQTIQLDD